MGRRFLAAAPELGGQPQLEQPACIVDIQPARDQQRLFGLQAASYWLIVSGKPVPRGTPDVRDL